LARATLSRRPWAALRFQIALENQARWWSSSVDARQLQGNWFMSRIVCALRSSGKLLSVEEISDHLKCSEPEVAAALSVLRRLRVIVVATAPNGAQTYALSPTGESQRSAAAEDQVATGRGERRGPKK
jgi:hypothetical protein